MQINIEELIEIKINEITEEYGEKAKSKVLEIILFKDMLTNKKRNEDIYIPITQFNKYYSYPKLSTIRKWISINKTRPEYKKEFIECLKPIDGYWNVIHDKFLQWRERRTQRVND